MDNKLEKQVADLTNKVDKLSKAVVLLSRQVASLMKENKRLKSATMSASQRTDTLSRQFHKGD